MSREKSSTSNGVADADVFIAGVVLIWEAAANEVGVVLVWEVAEMGVMRK